MKEGHVTKLSLKGEDQSSKNKEQEVEKGEYSIQRVCYDSMEGK